MTRCCSLTICAVCTLAAAAGVVADEQPSATIPPAAVGDTRFEPGEISIGEPLQVPFRRSDAAAPANAPAAPQRVPLTPPTPPSPAFVPSSPGSGPGARDGGRTADAAGSTTGTGWLGITADDTLVPGRLVIVDVAADGPAARAGIAPHDTLLGINGSRLRTADELAAALAALRPGADVKVAIGKGDRIDEKTLVAAARPAAGPLPGWQKAADGSAPADAAVAPADPGSAGFVTPVTPRTPPRLATPSQPAELPPPSLVSSSDREARGRTALGVRTVPIDSDMQARYRLPQPRGAYVIGVVHDLPASKAGVPPGSVIVALGDQPVRDPGDLTRLVASGPVGAPVPLHYILPGGESRQADVVLQSLELPLERALLGDAAADGDAAIAGEPPGTLQQSRRQVTSPAMVTSEPPTPPAASRPQALEEQVLLLRQRVESLERQLDQLAPRRLR